MTPKSKKDNCLCLWIPGRHWAMSRNLQTYGHDGNNLCSWRSHTITVITKPSITFKNAV